MAQAFIRLGEDLSRWWVKVRSWKLTLPDPPPPPWPRLPDWDRPHAQDSTSISSLCLASRDSPLIVPIRAKIELAIMRPPLG